MTGPSNPIPYNRDIWAIEKNVASNLNAIQTKKVTMTGLFWGIIMNQSDPVEVYVAGLAADWGAARLPIDEAWRSREPSFYLEFPMIDSLDAVQVDISNSSQEVVGVASFVFYFRSFLEGILPPKTKGIRVVVENSCGPQVFTYQVDGEEAVYLGQTDVHESKYDHLMHKATIGELVSYSTTKLGSGNYTNKKSSYTGLPLADDFCPKTLKVYPSSSIEDEYHTNQPALFASVAALIFIATSLIFLSYDWYVAHRQRIVMGRAKASGAIVDSLFPEAVRDQLYEEQRDVDTPGKTSGFNTFKNDGTLMSSVPESPIEKSRPIAQVYEGKFQSNAFTVAVVESGCLCWYSLLWSLHLYVCCAETTILFMDLAGFTQWSSTRQPVDVFELLESVYSQFDKIALKRQVFVSANLLVMV